MKNIQELKVKDLLPTIPKREVITIPCTASCAQALELLNKYNLHSVPVLNEHGKAIGFIDFLDIIAYLLHVMETPEKEFKGELPSLTGKAEEIGVLFQRILRFTCQTVSNAIDLSARNPFVPLSLEVPLCELVDLFCQGIHRVPIVDDEGKIICIVSQSQLLQFLVKHAEAIEDLKHKTALELGLGSTVANMKELQAVDLTTRALDAFRLMATKGLSAVPVFNSSGLPVGQVSASDLRVLGPKLASTPHQFSELLLPLVDFLPLVRRREKWLVACSPNTSLEEILRLLQENAVQRCYFIDDEGKLFGVASITDIANVLLKCKFPPREYIA